MIDGFGIHGLYNTQIISNTCNMGNGLTEPASMTAMLGEIKSATCQRESSLIGGHTCESLAVSNTGR